jgi:hypothetical protein
MGGCGNQREEAMAEVREMGGRWSKREREVRKRIKDGMAEGET